jgi:hypothetical protein
MKILLIFSPSLLILQEVKLIIDALPPEKVKIEIEKKMSIEIKKAFSL